MNRKMVIQQISDCITLLNVQYADKLDMLNSNGLTIREFGLSNTFDYFHDVIVKSMNVKMIKSVMVFNVPCNWTDDDDYNQTFSRCNHNEVGITDNARVFLFSNGQVLINYTAGMIPEDSKIFFLNSLWSDNDFIIDFYDKLGYVILGVSYKDFKIKSIFTGSNSKVD